MAETNPMHLHMCRSCQDTVVCVCSDKRGEILCLSCSDLLADLQALHPNEDVHLEKVN